MFLGPFKDEMLSLIANGVTIGDRTWKVKINAVTADSIARPFLTNVRQFNARRLF